VGLVVIGRIGVIQWSVWLNLNAAHILMNGTAGIAISRNGMMFECIV